MQAGFNVAVASTVTLDAALSFEAYGVIDPNMPACPQLPNLITFWEAFLDFMIDHDKSAVQAHSHDGSIYQGTTSVSHFILLRHSWLVVSLKASWWTMQEGSDQGIVVFSFWAAKTINVARKFGCISTRGSTLQTLNFSGSEVTTAWNVIFRSLAHVACKKTNLFSWWAGIRDYYKLVSEMIY